MNRERLKTLRDHLAGLPDERVDMSVVHDTRECGTVACIAGWAEVLFPEPMDDWTYDRGLGLTDDQCDWLFMPDGWSRKGRYTRLDAIAAIDSMLANPAEDALPVWPKSPTQSEEAGQPTREKSNG